MAAFRNRCTTRNYTARAGSIPNKSVTSAAPLEYL